MKISILHEIMLLEDSKKYTTIFGALKFPTFVSWHTTVTMKMYIILITCLLTKNLKKKFVKFMINTK